MKSLQLILALLLPIATYAQTNLTVNANQVVRTVDEKVFGLNAVAWDGNSGSAQTISLLQAAGIRTIRIPGGSLSDEYHWRTNTTLINTWTWSAGFNIYTDLITGLNAQTFVTVNYGTGTPQEAAAWVAYANASASILGTGSDVLIGLDSKGYDWKTAGYWSALRNSAPLGSDDGMNFLRRSRSAPLGLKYWEIGNECYGTWETDQQAVAHDPYTYAIRAKDYIARMKAVDPTIKIGCVSQTLQTDNVNNTSHPATNPRTGIVYNGWTPVMLATLKAAPAVTPDFLIYHRYEQAPKIDNPGNPETDAGLLQKAKTWPNDATALRQQLTDYIGSPGAGVELMITENNSVYGKPGKQTTSLVNALYYADSVGNLLQTEFNSLAWWDLRNGQSNGTGQVASDQPNLSTSLYGWRLYGDYGILSSVSSFGSTTAYDPYPTYYAFKLLSHFARGGDTVVQATSSNTLLSIFAAKRTDGSLTLLVINKDPANTLSANIALTGFTPGATATTYTYGKPQDTAAQLGSGSTDLATSTMSISGTTFSASFASYSITVISLAPAVVAPAITTQPASQTIIAGNSVTFTAAASGTAPLTYQWQKNNVNISGATSSSFTITSTVPSDAGNYTLIATNSANSATSNPAILTITATAPAITTQPASQKTIIVGTSVTFSAVASGNPAPTYQWQKNSANIIGATSSSYTITNAATGDAGVYTVIATNVAGTATSNSATLTVNVVPVFTTHPLSVPAFVGSTINLTSVATSSTAITYQWQKNGINISGATNSSLSLAAVQLTDAGNYAVIATDAVGSATSRFARLVVLVAQTNAIVYATTVSSTSVTAGGVVNLAYFMTNVGTQAWGAAHYLSIRDINGTFVGFSSLIGTLPGETTTAILNFPAPATPGTYTYYVQALENGVQFFSTQTTLTLTVLAPLTNSITYNTTTFPVSAAPGSVVVFTYNVTNTGSQTWGANHLLSLKDSNSATLSSALLTVLTPGSSKTVNLSFTAPSAPGTYNYTVQASQTGVGDFNTHADLTLTVLAPRPNAIVYTRTRSPDEVVPGALLNLNYSLSNAGTQSWGTGHYASLRDENGTFLAFLPLNGVATGGKTNVAFSFNAPTAPGLHTFYVQAFEDGIEFFSTQDVVVVLVDALPLSNAITYNTTTFPATVAPGSTVSFTYNITNRGTKTWGATDFLSFRDVDNTFLGFPTISGVAPGASKTVAISFTAPTTPGIYTYKAQGLEDGVAFYVMDDTLVLFVQ